MEVRPGMIVAAVAVMIGLAGCQGGGTSTAGGGDSGSNLVPGGGAIETAGVIEKRSPTVQAIEPAWALQGKITIDVTDVTLTQVAAQISRGKSIEIVYDDKLHRERLGVPVTLRLTGVTVDSALYWMTEGTGLTYYFDDKRVVLTTAEDMTEERKAQLEKFRGALERRWRGAMEKELASQKVSCDMDELTLGDAAGELQDHYGVNIVASPELMGKKVSAKLEERPVKEVVEALAKSAGASWKLEHEAIHFEEAKH